MMSTIHTVMRVRESAAVTAEGLVEAFNIMHDAIIQSGMTQVSDGDFTGQAKTFSTTSGAGLTQVTKQVVYHGVETKVGYKVYKHPTLMLYLRLWFIDFNQASAANASFARFKYQFSTALNGVGGFKSEKTSNEFYSTEVFLYNSTSSSQALGTNYFPAVYEKLTVSCGDDHFCIGSDGGIESNPSASYYSLPQRLNINSVGVFTSNKDSGVLCVVYGQMTYSSALVSGRITGESSSGAADAACLRYMLCNNGAWSLLDNGAAGQLDNPRVNSTVNGVRVAQAKLVVNGEFHRFNFGFVPHKALNSFAIVTINMTGISQKYQALPYMGFANHSPPVNDYLNMSSAIFPVVG